MIPKTQITNQIISLIHIKKTLKSVPWNNLEKLRKNTILMMHGWLS